MAKTKGAWAKRIGVEWTALSLRFGYWSDLKIIRWIALCLLMVPLGNAMTIYRAFRPDPKSAMPYFLALIFAVVAVFSIGALAWAFVQRVRLEKKKAQWDPKKIAVEAKIAVLRGREYAQKEARDLAAELARQAGERAEGANDGADQPSPSRPKPARRL